MGLEVWLWWLNGLQLVLVGVAVMIAAHQAMVWHWEGSGSSARAMVFAAGSASLVLVVNAAVLVWVSSGYAELLLDVRSLALTVLMVSVVGLARAVSRDAWPWWVDAIAVALIVARLALWQRTDLVFLHRVVAGSPRYGSLLVPTTLVVEVVLAGYLVALVLTARSSREAAILAVGGFGSLVLAAVSVLVADPVAAELLTGFLTVPALAGIAVVVWLRQNHTQRAVLRLASRQRAVADFSRTALTVTGPDLDREALRLLSDYHRTPDEEAADEDFRRTVTRVWEAAAARARTAEELGRRTMTDELTGLPNRQRLRARIQELLTGPSPSSSSVAVVFGNLNRLGAVNDADGHSAGDRVLRAVADRLASTAAACDLVGRFRVR